MALASKYDTKQLLKTFLRDVTQKNKLNEVMDKYVTQSAAVEELKKINEIPFSSARKYSACVYHDMTLVLGAPEMLLEKDSPVLKNCEAYTNESYRVVVFGKAEGEYKEKNGDIKKKFHPLAIIAIDDPVREDAHHTLEQLLKENIAYRIISGDSPNTVVSIAKKINKDYPANVISGDELDKLSGADLEKAIIDHTIFARIKPQQKQLIIRVLKQNKLFTIMIGDGVNDVLALKESDLGVAMNGGSSMAKDVADVVLLNNSFSTLPILLYEGRRIITNIQTIANLYLIKNVSSILTVLMLGFIGLRFPFESHHVELTSFLIIGLPSFALAFEKHTFIVSDEGFLKRLLLFSGIVGFGDALLYTTLYTYYSITTDKLFYERTMLLTAVVFLGICNIFLIYLQHYSFHDILKRKIVIGLVLFIVILFSLSILLPSIRELFMIKPLRPLDLLICLAYAVGGSMIISIVLRRFALLQKDA